MRSEWQTPCVSRSGAQIVRRVSPTRCGGRTAGRARITTPNALRIVECAGDLDGEAYRFVHRQELLAIEPVAQRLHLHVRHHTENLAICLVGVVARQDVRV